MLRNSLLLVLALALSSATAATAEQLKPYESCLPPESTDSEIRATASSDGADFYYLGITAPQGYGIAVVEVVDGQCRLAIPPDDGETELHEVMPVEVAGEIWLGNYQFAIEKAGGVEALEAMFQEEANPIESYTYRSELQIAALDELGIAVPDSYTLTSHDPNRQAALDAFLASEPSGPKYVNELGIAGDYAVARWVLFDLGGVMVGRQVDGEWQVLGFTTEDDEPVTPHTLQAKFDVPLEIARELLGSGA